MADATKPKYTWGTQLAPIVSASLDYGFGVDAWDARIVVGPGIDMRDSAWRQQLAGRLRTLSDALIAAAAEIEAGRG